MQEFLNIVWVLLLLVNLLLLRKNRKLIREIKERMRQEKQLLWRIQEHTKDLERADANLHQAIVDVTRPQIH